MQIFHSFKPSESANKNRIQRSIKMTIHGSEEKRKRVRMTTELRPAMFTGSPTVSTMTRESTYGQRQQMQPMGHVLSSRVANLNYQQLNSSFQVHHQSHNQHQQDTISPGFHRLERRASDLWPDILDTFKNTSHLKELHCR